MRHKVVVVTGYIHTRRLKPLQNCLLPRPAVIALALALLPGCRQVFGIDDLPETGDTDAPVARSQVTFRQVDLDAAGQVLDQPHPFSSTDGAVIVDGIEVALDREGFFDLPGPGLHRIAIRVDDVTTEYQTSATPFTAVWPQIGRRKSMPARDDSLVYSAVPASLAADSLLATTGQWSTVQKSAATVPTFALGTAAPTYHPIGAFDAELNDAAYFLSYETIAGSTPGSPYRRIGHYRVDPITSFGVTQEMSGTLEVPDVYECTHVVTHSSAEQNTFVGAQSVWSISATPAPALDPEGLLLVGTSTVEAADANARVDLANPFPFHTSVLTSSVFTRRVYGDPTGQPVDVGLFSAFTVSVPATLGCEDGLLTEAPSGRSPLPEQFAVDGVPMLEASNNRVEPQLEHLLSWSLRGSQSAAHFEVTLLDLGAGDSLVNSGFLPTTFVTDAPSVVLPANLLAPGHRYAARVAAFGAGADAPLRGTVEYPYAYGVTATPLISTMQ